MRSSPENGPPQGVVDQHQHQQPARQMLAIGSCDNVLRSAVTSDGRPRVQASGVAKEL
jgi:hypothetical protein